jgi:hypothetical protein
MSVAIPQLLQYAFMAWCLVKHRDNLSFLGRGSCEATLCSPYKRLSHKSHFTIFHDKQCILLTHRRKIQTSQTWRTVDCGRHISELAPRRDLWGLLWSTSRIRLIFSWDTVRRGGPCCRLSEPIADPLIYAAWFRYNTLNVKSNTGVGFQLCQPQNAIHFLGGYIQKFPHWVITK